MSHPYTFDIRAYASRDKYTLNHQLSPAELVEAALRQGEGTLADNGALVCATGKFTGRSPKDRYFVQDAYSQSRIWWGEVNRPLAPEHAARLHTRMLEFMADKDLYVRDAYVGVHSATRLSLRVVNTQAWHNLFCHNMFLRVPQETLSNFKPDFTILAVPEFEADPTQDGVDNPNFVIIDLSRRLVLIGGTAYAGEMKKSLFTIMNFFLPEEHGILPMHCSANQGPDGDVAIFFGLSGTGKTTLSADPTRRLIGDDEHGWSDQEVFNFEGGCYAKVINLSEKQEPQIWHAIRFGAIVENTQYLAGTRTIDYENDSITENTRTSYPIHHIDKAIEPSRGPLPRHLFFLTADAFGVLPPISRLQKEQAMYHFISGYTAKVAGTEAGITEPKAAFSACFGAPFLPLHPTRYAEMLGKKMDTHDVTVWLINTGWSGGPYGIGTRIHLPYTRAMIHAALSGQLQQVSFQSQDIFGVEIPASCPEVPTEILQPRNTWEDKSAYDAKARTLAQAFHANFEKYKDFAHRDILKGGPRL